MVHSLDKELNLAINQNQRLKAKILGFIFTGILLIETILISLFHEEEIFRKLIDKKAVYFGPFFLLGMAGMEFYIAHSLARQIRNEKQLPRRYQYLAAFLEACFPTLVIFLAARLVLDANNPAVDIRFLLNSPPLVFYFIFVILSALQLEMMLCVFTGAVSAIGYLVLSFYLTATYSQSQIFDYIDNIGKTVFIFLSGVISGIVARKIREAVLSSLKSKNDLIFTLDAKVKEKTAEINEKNQLLEQKNKDITDSINYAKRIQQAKLPDRKDISAVFPDSFVLFKPKDIVSGDFYYFHQNEKSAFIASADCTGHGVPGAFMSMIASEKLDEALGRTGNVSEILSHLNKGIKFSLRQTDSQESTRDGMDIALCAFKKEMNEISFAGANRPLWIIRNGKNSLEEIKPTKKAIGGFTEDGQHFESQVIQLQKGDTFYIFTDGYADTFGGKQEKKVTTKKFREILLSIRHHSMDEQEKHLDGFIEDWKAGTEQVDDILVIGVRV